MSQIVDIKGGKKLEFHGSRVSATMRDTAKWFKLGACTALLCMPIASQKLAETRDPWSSNFFWPLVHPRTVHPFPRCLKLAAFCHPYVFCHMRRDGVRQVRTCLISGETAIFDNSRCLHGRKGYEVKANSKRLYQGTYIAWDEIRSRMNVIRYMSDEAEH